MLRIVYFLGLSLSACPLLAQEVFEVPIELGLPAAPLVFELSNASLDVVLEDGVEPVLRAFAGASGTTRRDKPGRRWKYQVLAIAGLLIWAIVDELLQIPVNRTADVYDCLATDRCVLLL